MATLKRLASRGGRIRTSTRFPVFGASIKKGGLHQPPFCISSQRISDSDPSQCLKRRPPQLIAPPIDGLKPGQSSEWRKCWTTTAEKGERPVGVPAARRGDGGKRNPKLIQFFRVVYAALASSKTPHRSSATTPGSRNQLQITIAILLSTLAEVDRAAVPSPRYFKPRPSVPFRQYLRTLALHPLPFFFQV